MTASDFYPPKPWPWLIRLLQWNTPWMARHLYWITLHIAPQQLHTLNQLHRDRILLLPNHPTFHDPIVLFMLSAQLKQPFYFMAAHETFQTPSTMFLISAGFRPLQAIAHLSCINQTLRWFLQRLGMYSIRRGLADRPSIAQTLRLLTQPDCHLVIFPEGGCSFQNDTVMPFRVGAIQMAFQTLNKYDKAQEPIPNLYIIPVSIKYFYTDDPQPIIERSLQRLETHLQIQPDPDPYQRLRNISENVLSSIEADYGMTPDIHQTWNDRILALKNYLINTCEQHLSLSPAPNDLIRERVYRIQNHLRSHPDLSNPNPSNPDLSNPDQPWNPSWIEKTMGRLLNFDAIYDGYVGTKPTPERFLDTLIRLERHVFNIDQPPPKGRRTAHVVLGDPYNLADRLPDYQRDRAATIEQVNTEIHQIVQANIATHPES
jgi:1-acyl-sn-glycerol-3-phosphate acyltransferase